MRRTARRWPNLAILVFVLALVAACGDDGGDESTRPTSARAPRLPCIEDTVDIFLVAGGPIGSTVPSFATPQAAADDAASSKGGTAVLVGEESDDVRFSIVTSDRAVVEEVVVGQTENGWQVKSHETCPDGEGAGESSSAPTAQDRQLIDDLIAFARHPSIATLSPLPFPEAARLGLGADLLVPRSFDELADPGMWSLETETYFRGYVGPFSALDVLRDVDEFEVSVGAHPHCASPSERAPAGMESHRRVSVQPVGIDTCISWFTVDVFLSPGGAIEAVTLDLWEP